VIGLAAIRLLVTGAIALSASVAPASAAAPPGPGVDRPVTDPRIAESSGLAASPSHPGVLWTHDDSGNPPRLFALGRSGKVGAALRLTGVPDVDWEALAAFRDSAGRPLLAVGDLGDNLADRGGVEVDVVAEPSELREAQVAPLLRLRLHYPDGPRDAETLLVDPVRARMFVVSKGLLGSGVYVVPASAWNGTAPIRPTVRSATLVRVGVVPLALVTDGTVARSGSVLLRTYDELAVLDPLPLDTGSRLLVARATTALPGQRQGEGLALAPDGRSVLLSSEGAGQPVVRFPLPDAVRAALSSPSGPPSGSRSGSAASASGASPEAATSSAGAGAGGRGSGASPGAPTRSGAPPSERSSAGATTADSSSVGPSSLPGGLGLVAGLTAIGAAAVVGTLGRVGRRRGRRMG
jgi:hypothetical protein